MKKRGIIFLLLSEEHAISYLAEENNYLRTASYRKNYEKYQLGENKGKYLNLDFAYLRELSAIDMHLRRHLLTMCVDLEHAFKLKILNEIVLDPKDDGYDIVRKFLDTNEFVKNNIARQAGKFFTGNLVNKYFNIDVSDRRNPTIIDIDCPVWVLLEILTFGDFLSFYEFYCDLYQKPKIERGVLNPVKDLRNACAHNNCLLTNLQQQKNTAPSKTISEFVSKIKDIGDEERRKKLKSRPLFDITCLLYLQKECMPSDRFKGQLSRLNSFLEDRVILHNDYFGSNLLIVSSYRFIKKMVDFLARDL